MIVPVSVGRLWSWYLHVPISLKVKLHELPGVTDRHASNELPRQSALDFSGYTLCVGCVIEAGQVSRELSFTNITESPCFISTGLGL